MPATLMSVAESELLPDAPGKQELLYGEAIALPPAKLSHDKTARSLFRLLTSALGEPRVYMESGYQMSRDNWLQPDVSR